MPRSFLGSKSFKGRGVSSNVPGRFDSLTLEQCDDGWYQDEIVENLSETVVPDRARSVISTNDSPDVGFEASINPYRGCSHGCIYCFARPTHAYVNLSSGLDFETKLFYKANAAELLARELSRPAYRPEVINLGASTDPYQPIEREHAVTRALLEVLLNFRHPVTIVTKGHLVLRDLDLLQELARLRLCYVMISVTTLDEHLKRGLEPRAPSPAARLKAVRALSEAGVPVGVLAAPIIPALNEHELEDILAAAAAAGAVSAGFVLLRLPYEIKDLFEGWLRDHVPLRAEHVLSRIRAMRGGKLNEAQFGTRFKGTGVEAQLLARRFELACRKLGLDSRPRHALDLGAFRVPGGGRASAQLSFDGL